MGPCEVSCPMKYLELAPYCKQLEGGYSKEWRERVKTHWENRKKGRELAKTLQLGDSFKVNSTDCTPRIFCGWINLNQRKFSVVGMTENGERYRYNVNTIVEVIKAEVVKA